ncbi:NAD(P)H-dependent glycerol-3-phosphate dehydrogenase [Mechercharimyces sp. CAU 1602]|uniref:NAD(P)H-dependent glycerol-3-phosphate dehydrogenase n=1 Tax=Mechercharimyces sp. CAU 1602 TaxID=2973933 RepID=UPI002163C2A7|nr:NAD(P)H-dependent glycerol-3-phosphate dehydrogenase [Mechercharimyces sp. CAU 1602]MCS1350969.1 NAD(P)H-dependent glycerol-3-phosphate dehydrogenase [Mechercharimyces sp. CAU 1602]
MAKVAVVGAGSWGTALAAVLADNGNEVLLWARHAEVVTTINEKRCNQKYLPTHSLPDGLQATSSMMDAVDGAELILVAVPSHALRAVVREVRPYLGEEALVVHATKGFELDSLKRMSEVIVEEVPSIGNRVAVLSGPSHAEEVIAKQPTTVVIASHSEQTACVAQSLFINSYFRVYTNPDVIGVEIGGALKNIIALGAGLSDGLGFGDNAKAALMTRGLAEMTRLGTKMGADAITFLGLAGVGDLMVTCTSHHSRNWRAGHLLGQGKALEDVLQEMGMVVEGVKTTRATQRLATSFEVEMPITTALYKVLFEGMEPRLAVEALMNRGKTSEAAELLKG